MVGDAATVPANLCDVSYPIETVSGVDFLTSKSHRRLRIYLAHLFKSYQILLLDTAFGYSKRRRLRQPKLRCGKYVVNGDRKIRCGTPI